MPNTTRSARFKVELDGEKEWKQAITELNTGNRTLATEMKKLQSEFKGQTDSEEFLTKKSDLLNRQLQQQHDKVEKLRGIVMEAAKATGESSATTQRYMQQLNLAEAAEFDFEHEIEKTNKALDNQDKEMQAVDNTVSGLGDTVSGLADKLGIHLPKGATNALNGMKGLSAGTVAAMGAAAAGVAALIKTVKSLQEETIAAAARADDILTQSTKMNISAAQYQALKYASPFVDVNVDTMASSLAKLTKTMADAQAGGAAAIEAFRSLGVEIQDTDGHLRSAYDVWLDTMDALSQLGNETERDAAAQALLGKSAAEFAPIYREGTEALREYTEAAQESYVMSDDQLAQLGAVDDAWNKLQLDIEGNKNMIAAEWAPTAQKALETFDRLVTAAGKALVDSGIIQGFGELVQYGIALLDPIASLLESADSAPGRLSPVYEILHGIAGVLAWIADAANAAAGLLSGNFGQFTTALGFGAKNGNYSNLQKWQMDRDKYYASANGNYYNASTGMYSGNYFAGNATGNDNWRGGLTWVGEAGPELLALPNGTRIYSAQESRGVAGGDTIINVTVNGIEELEEIVNWYQSRRIQSRMR